MNDKHDENSELLIDLLIGCLKEEGYEVLRFQDSKKYSTSAYDALEVKRYDGVHFQIDIDKHKTFVNPRTGEIEEDCKIFNDLKSEVEDC